MAIAKADFSDRALGEADGAQGAQGAPRIYYLHPTIGGGPEAWPTHVARAAQLGFRHILLAWPFSATADLFLTDDLDIIAGRPAKEALAALAAACRNHELAFWIDLAPAQASGHGALARAQPESWLRPETRGIDPRILHRTPVLQADFARASRALVALWQEQLELWQGIGVSGVRCHAAERLPLATWREILEPARRRDPHFAAFAWMPGAPRDAARAAAELFDYLPSSAAWWDGRSPWLAQEYNDLAERAAVIGFPVDPFAARGPGPSPVNPDRNRQMALSAASLLGDGWLMPMGFEYGMDVPFAQAGSEDFEAAQASGPRFAAQIEAANRFLAAMPGDAGGSLRLLQAVGDQTALLRTSRNGSSHLVVLNRDPINACRPDLALLSAQAGGRPSVTMEDIVVAPAEGLALPLSPALPV
ncbi:MAG: hypothetical protein ACK4VM_09425, partial [Bosea sp. (in: a-proteobacteria)]